MKTGQFSNFLRKFKLMYLFDRLRYYIKKLENKKINNEFKKQNPEVKLPPDYLIYESFQLNYAKYYTDSIETAKWLTSHFEKHIDLNNKTILDWGCGPARIIRHLPNIMTNNCRFFGTDYNKKSIKWCTENIKDVNFNTNSLVAKLPYEDNFFDIIYGISIFTHLSEKMHYNWFDELCRIIKPNGIIFLTMQGDNFKVKLTENELREYNKGKLIVRGEVKEGHRTYSAFHPKEFVKNMFQNVKILNHIEIKSTQNSMPQQDIWIVKKN